MNDEPYSTVSDAPILSEREALGAAEGFLGAYFDRTSGKGDIATLVSDLAVEADGSTSDPAALDDWRDALAEVRSTSGRPSFDDYANDVAILFRFISQHLAVLDDFGYGMSKGAPGEFDGEAMSISIHFLRENPTKTEAVSIVRHVLRQWVDMGAATDDHVRSVGEAAFGELRDLRA